MSVLNRVLGVPEPDGLDDVMAARLELVYRHIEPDPLFRRRLRGEIVNRAVAEREGHLRRPSDRARMGALGRAVLYASLGLALGVSATGAAAAESLPGDLLYAVKLRAEEIRMRVAPPSLQDDLAAMTLAERVDELERLADAGSWGLVPAAAARVVAAEEALFAIDPGIAADAATTDALAALEEVLAGAPPQAQAGLERALDVVGAEDAAPRSEPGTPVPAPRPSPAAGAAGRPAGASPAKTAGAGTQKADEDRSGVKRGPQSQQGRGR